MLILALIPYCQISVQNEYINLHSHREHFKFPELHMLPFYFARLNFLVTLVLWNNIHYCFNWNLPIINGTKHLFTFLWAIYVKFRFCGVPVHVLWLNFNWVVCFLLSDVWDANSFLTIDIFSITFYSVAYLFKFLLIYFYWWIEYFILMWLYLSDFSFIIYTSRVLFKECFLPQIHKNNILYSKYWSLYKVWVNI